MRARGAWFGNRSVAAEVDLEAGVYEVVPKIVATRDSDVPEAIDVVKKLAQRNPQKLRQIGMNYDMANAKGVVEVSEEEKKKVLEEKKAKENEADEKSATESEVRKKAGQALSTAWKKYKQAKEKKKAQEERKGKDTLEPKEESKDNETQKEQSDAPNAKTEEKHDDDDDEPIDISALAEEVKANPPTSDSELKQLLLMLTNHILSPDSDSDSTSAPEPTPADLSLPSGRDKPPSKTEDHEPWNAVCTLGLRVYSLDPNVTIQLIKPQSVAETAILDVDGATPAGATM